jgi:predicted permease
VTFSVWFDHRAAEVRYALRMIRKTPAASAVAVLSLALGIGANTAIFSFVDALLLRSLPIRSPGELYQVASSQRGPLPRTSWNYPDYCAFRDRVPAFSGMLAWSGVQPVGMQETTSAGAQSSELAYVAEVSGNYFDVLGVIPSIGRLLNPADDKLGGSPYAVLGYDYWYSRFLGDTCVIGRTIRLNGYPVSIVGVTRHAFRGADPSVSPNVFVPVSMHAEIFGVAPKIWNSRHYWFLQVLGRIPSPARVAEAGARLETVILDQEATERQTTGRKGPVNTGLRMLVLPAARGYTGARTRLEMPLLILMAVVGVVLLIACANVASLMLGRAAARRREIAVRLAMGASRLRLASQLLVESTILSLMGGVAGLAFAYLCVQVLLTYASQGGGPQTAIQVTPDARLLGFTLAVSIATGLLFGLAPALRATRPELVPALKDDAAAGQGRERVLLRKMLVVAQVALSLLLLVGAGLFARTLGNLKDLDAGFRRGQTIVAEVDPSRNGYKGQRMREFYERLRTDASRIPGVQSVSLAAITPLGGRRWNEDVAIEGYTWKAGEQKFVDMNAVGPRYFETVGIPLIVGRDFTDEDNPATSENPPDEISSRPGRPEPPGPRVMIVTESLVKRFFAGRNPIGMHICLTVEYDPARAYEIVGVVKDARYFGMRQALEPMMYVPTWRGDASSRALCLRAAGDPAPVMAAVRRAVTTIDPGVPLLRARTIEQQVDADIVVERFIATLSGTFGLLALLLAVVGLYGVISHAAVQRTREIGIRMALGASRGSIAWLVGREAGGMVAVGVAIGLPLAFLLSRLIQGLLYGVAAQDPGTIVFGIAVLAAAAAVAALLPAWRAASVHPNEALRYE